MMLQDGFVQKLESAVLVNNVRGQNVLCDRGLSCRRYVIVVVRKPELQPRHAIGPDKESQVKCFSIVIIGQALHRVRIRAGTAAIADLGNVMQSELVRNNSGRADSYAVDRQDASVVFKVEEEWASQSGLHQGAVMIGGVIKAHRCVITAELKVEVVINGIDKLHAFEIDAEFIGSRTGFNYRFCKKRGFIGQAGAYEKVELPQGEGVSRFFLVAGVRADICISSQLQLGGCIVPGIVTRHGLLWSCRCMGRVGCSRGWAG